MVEERGHRLADGGLQVVVEFIGAAARAALGLQLERVQHRLRGVLVLRQRFAFVDAMLVLVDSVPLRRADLLGHGPGRAALHAAASVIDVVRRGDLL
ncbi:hypothetical protein [Pirellulimonas nuda]|uniref:hypothetical protein n=1 Tax=Pirellulimonas nuda TaxID=2528009 RepID=UPI001E44F83D|nr:hypothetical protein [Pirellulimonas nuda]